MIRIAIGHKPFLSILKASGATFIDDANEKCFVLVKQIGYIYSNKAKLLRGNRLNIGKT